MQHYTANLLIETSYAGGGIQICYTMTTPQPPFVKKEKENIEYKSGNAKNYYYYYFVVATHW